MQKYTSDDLNDLIKIYVESLDDRYKDSRYATDQQFAAVEISKFLEWIENREPA